MPRKNQTATTETVSKQSPVGKPMPARIQNSKKAAVVAALARPEGATMPEITEITGWQKHSISAFISKTVKQALGHKVVQTARVDGPNAYRIDVSSEG